MFLERCSYQLGKKWSKFHSIMFRFGDEFYDAKKPITIGCLNDAIRLLVLIFPEMNGYVKTFKDKNNKCLRI